MLLRWDGNRPLADAEMIATLYEVSTRTVRRHCPVVRYEPRVGSPRGRGGVALYDAFTAGEQLVGVAPRPERTRIALHYRMTQNQTPP